MLRIRWKPNAIPAPWHGKALHIFDGDTLSVSGLAVPQLIRIYGIDAPDFGQAFYHEARNALISLLKNKTLRIHPVDRDRYGRIVAVVMTPPAHVVALDMLDRGLAWWDYRFAPLELDNKHAQQIARAAKKGIWSRPHWGFAPWVFRRRSRLFG